MPRVDTPGDLPEGLKSLSLALAFLLRYDAYNAGWLDDENWMPAGRVIEELQRGGKGRQPLQLVSEEDLQTVVRTSFTRGTPRFEMRFYGGQCFLRAVDGEKRRQKLKKSGRNVQPSQRNSQGSSYDQCTNDRGDWSPRSSLSDTSGISGVSRMSSAAQDSRASHSSQASPGLKGGKVQRRSHGSSYRFGKASSSGFPPGKCEQSGRVATAARANHPTTAICDVQNQSVGQPGQKGAQGSFNSASDTATVFQGAWCKKDTPGTVFCRIDGRALFWEGVHGLKAQTVQIDKDEIVLLDEHGKINCCGNLVLGQLLWKDDDIWIRASSAAEPCKTPTEPCGREVESSQPHRERVAQHARHPTPHLQDIEEGRSVEVEEVYKEVVPPSPPTFDMRGNNDSEDDPCWDEMRAKKDFDGSEYGEEYLSFCKGELLHVRHHYEQGWALARLMSRDGDKEGWVPPDFLHVEPSL